MSITEKERAIIDFYLFRRTKNFPDFVNFINTYCPEQKEEFEELIYRGKKIPGGNGYEFLYKGALKKEFYDRFILNHKELCKRARTIHLREKSINHTKSLRSNKKKED